MIKLRCNLCPHYCNLGENQIGLCKARSNLDGKIIPLNYGKVTAIGLDPIEKKPLKRFESGKQILSVGSFGCNLNCSFCQNHHISMAFAEDISYQEISPEKLVRTALDLKDRSNIGIAYTYNEPLIGYEFVRDCSILAKENGLKNLVITNGCFNEEPMKELFPYIDAFNIDLKGFTNDFYRDIRGNLDTVKKFITLAAKYSHVEVTTLIIPGENDSREEMEELSEFIASIDPNIPLHISRFFPSYKMKGRRPTEIEKIIELKDIARSKLKYIYNGNIF